MEDKITAVLQFIADKIKEEVATGNYENANTLSQVYQRIASFRN